jgi:hypothetical protein
MMFGRSTVASAATLVETAGSKAASARRPTEARPLALENFISIVSEAQTQTPSQGCQKHGQSCHRTPRRGNEARHRRDESAVLFSYPPSPHRHQAELLSRMVVTILSPPRKKPGETGLVNPT